MTEPIVTVPLVCTEGCLSPEDVEVRPDGAWHWVEGDTRLLFPHRVTPPFTPPQIPREVGDLR